MDTIGNPFGAPPPPPPPVNTNVTGNPFGEATTQQQDSPWGVTPPQQNDTGPPTGYTSAYSTQSNPFGAPPTQSSSYGISPHMQYQNSYQVQPPTQLGYPTPTPTPPSNNPFGAPQTHNTAVVLATNQSNPYALAPQAQYGLPNQQQIVPVNQQQQPWAMTQQNQQLVPPNFGGYDPFTQQQHLAPAPAPIPPSHDIDLFLQPQQQAIEPYQQTQQQQQQHQPEMEPYVVKSEEPPQVAANGHVREPPHEKEENKIEIKEAPDVAASPEGTMYPPQIQYGHRPDIKPDREPTDSSPRNPYAPILAQEAPPGASPLPKAELVRKRGFALSRISFRTIVMKKWKQTYWVQYGPHTMLWFRSQADFDDWLNNPYHMQTERNFLIKLAVNFVHDLYKPNVRGYQVTQCRTKGYGNKIVRQFKLERWMDYGPTIAAAFGSYDPVEVDTLREAIVECMRNTPLEGGIRATGAVRQPNPNSSMPQRRDREEEDDDDDDDEDDGRQSSAKNATSDDQKDKKPKEPESVSEEADLLDVNNWDDVPIEPPQQSILNVSQPQNYGGVTPYSTIPNTSAQYPAIHQQQQQQQQHPVQALQPYGGPDSNPYALQSQQYPPQQMAYSNALVPATNQSQSYPGAPPPQQQWMPPPQHQPQHSGYPQQQQQQGFPQAPQHHQQAYLQHPDPWAAPKPQVQMQPPQY